MIPKKHHEQQDNVDSWLMSYADMITLLMCFFIIFVSVSEPKQEQFTAITNGLAGKFGTVDLSTPFQGVFQALEAIGETHQILKDFSIEKSETSIEMELSTHSFFQPNSAELADDKINILKEMVQALHQVDALKCNIIIEGHTSDVPVTGGLYPTNWELSGARASKLVRMFIEQGIPAKHLKAVALGDSHPKVPNLDANGSAILENRLKNDRMVIRLERPLS